MMSGLVLFGWGEIFSLFPSTLTDTYGPSHATSNYGFLYIAQGVGSVLGGPLAALLQPGDGLLDAGVRRDHRDEFRDGDSGADRPETDAAALD